VLSRSFCGPSRHVRRDAEVKRQPVTHVRHDVGPCHDVKDPAFDLIMAVAPEWATHVERRRGPSEGRAPSPAVTRSTNTLDAPASWWHEVPMTSKRIVEESVVVPRHGGRRMQEPRVCLDCGCVSRWRLRVGVEDSRHAVVSLA